MSKASLCRTVTRLSLIAACAALALGALPVRAAGDTTRVIVAFKPGAAAAMRGVVSAARGSVDLQIHGMDAMAVTVPSAALAGLSRNPNVLYVEEDVKRYPFALATASTGDPYKLGQLVPWGINKVQADKAAFFNNTASPRTVCIIDSGIDRGHVDFSGLSVVGINDTGTGNWYEDQNGHGTHVAGTIAAMNNSGGVVGVAPNGNLNLFIVKVFDADGWAYSSTLASAANKCKSLGNANVISMSLGGSFKSRTEQTAFDNLLKADVLPIAAAGNGGNSQTSYPAGYASVVSVAATDELDKRASFSQYNKDVEIAAPGVSVLSTVPKGTGFLANLSAGNTTYAPIAMEGSPTASVSNKQLFDLGLGTTSDTRASGSVCLIQRGTNSFAEKVLNCHTSGGLGAVIYNNVQGSFSGTLGGTATTIPSMSVSGTEGSALKTQAASGTTAALGVGLGDYAYFDGTSMATPHVSAVAALVWSYNPACKATEIRNLLNSTALDFGAAGRDTSFGYGVVQAKAAYDKIGNCGQ